MLRSRLGSRKICSRCMRAIDCSDYQLKRCRNFSIPLRRHGDLGQKQIKTPSCATSALLRHLSSLFAIPQTAKQSVKTIVETTGSSEAIAEQTLALYFEPERNVLPRQGELNLNGLTQVIAFMGEAGTIKAPLPVAKRFVDLQYLEAAGLQ